MPPRATVKVLLKGKQMDPSQVNLVITETYDLVPNATTGILELTLVAQNVELRPKEQAPATATRRRAAPAG